MLFRFKYNLLSLIRQIYNQHTRLPLYRFNLVVGCCMWHTKSMNDMHIWPLLLCIFLLGKYQIFISPLNVQTEQKWNIFRNCQEQNAPLFSILAALILDNRPSYCITILTLSFSFILLCEVVIQQSLYSVAQFFT